MSIKSPSQEIIDAIRSEPLTLTYAQIAEKYNISVGTTIKYTKAECKRCIHYFIVLRDVCDLGHELKVCSKYSTKMRKRRSDAK
jgi:hypothetical protein